MALIKLAAASAAAYGLYRLITRQNETFTPSAQGLQPAGAGLTGGLVGGPTTSPQTPVGQGGNYVPPT